MRQTRNIDKARIFRSEERRTLLGKRQYHGDVSAMEDSKSVKQEQAQQPQQALASSSASATADGKRQGDRRGWGDLDEGILPLIAARLQRTMQRSLGSARLTCRKWAAELPQGCAWLDVEGKGPAGWEHLFCGLKELGWVCPELTSPSDGRWPKLRSLGLTRCVDGDLRMVRDLATIASLDLSGCPRITDTGMKELQHVPTLTFLDLECCNITDDGLKDLGGKSFLATLSLKFCKKITDRGLKNLVTGMPNLTSLNLFGCNKVTDGGLKELKGMSGLSDFNLDSCINVTDEGLKEISHMPNLTSLDLTSCSKITDQGLNYLKHLSALTLLNLTECEMITDESLVCLEHMRGLTDLNLQECKNITDDGLKYLSEHVSGIASLTLEHCGELTDDGLKHLRNMPNLTDLDLDSCRKITPDGLMHLRQMTNLSSLGIACCDKIVTNDEGLKCLKHMSYVTDLYLAGSDIMDEQLKYLTQMPALTSLDLSNCWEITDLGLKHIMQMTALADLNMCDCHRLTYAGWKDFVKKFVPSSPSAHLRANVVDVKAILAHQRLQNQRSGSWTMPSFVGTAHHIVHEYV